MPSRFVPPGPCQGVTDIRPPGTLSSWVGPGHFRHAWTKRWTQAPVFGDVSKIFTGTEIQVSSWRRLTPRQLTATQTRHAPSDLQEGYGPAARRGVCGSWALPGSSGTVNHPLGTGTRGTVARLEVKARAVAATRVRHAWWLIAL